jgi:hypothetical protein
MVGRSDDGVTSRDGERCSMNSNVWDQQRQGQCDGCGAKGLPALLCSDMGAS